MTSTPAQPVPPLPAGPLNAPIHGPRLPGHPGPAQPPVPQQRQFRPTLPVSQTDYPSFWRTPAWSWWRPLVAVLLAGVGWLLASAVLMSIGTAIDVATGRTDLDNFEPLAITPVTFIANNLGLALFIISAMVIAQLLFKQRPGFVSSVVGRLRWGWLARCFALLTPLWLVYLGALTWWEFRTGGFANYAINNDTWLVVFGILLTTPLQAAGEEFGFRGIANRAGASFFRNPKVAFAVGAVFSSLLFVAAHSAADPWLNLYYFLFGMVACLLTWRTGGLEAAIAMHVVNNVLASMISLPFTDFSDIFKRDAGVGDPSVLIGVAVMAVATVLVLWQAKRHGIEVTSAPGESTAQAMSGSLPMPPPPPRPAPLPAPFPPGQPQPPQAARPAAEPLDNPRPWINDGPEPSLR